MMLRLKCYPKCVTAEWAVQQYEGYFFDIFGSWQTIVSFDSETKAVRFFKLLTEAGSFEDEAAIDAMSAMILADGERGGPPTPAHMIAKRAYEIAGEMAERRGR